jgi:hypothetical protein
MNDIAIIDLIETNTAFYAALGKAEDDFNASFEGDPAEEDLREAMLRAFDRPSQARLRG